MKKGERTNVTISFFILIMLSPLYFNVSSLNSYHKTQDCKLIPQLRNSNINLSPKYNEYNQEQAPLLTIKRLQVIDPIIVIDDAELLRKAEEMSWYGDGSKTNPFIINGYKISAKVVKI